MASENDTLRQLLEVIREVKSKQETASAIQDLTARVAKLEAHLSSTLTTRSHGYVNWNSDHDILKTKHWKQLSEFINFCSSLERDEIPECYVNIKINHKCVVDEATRFPQDIVHINVANPIVRAEIMHILHLRKLMKPAPGLVQRFLNIAQEEMHTRSSFEEKYGLKWIEPLKNNV